MSASPTPKVIIVGSGPAGYTAAIYLSRANIPNLLFEGSQPGGQLTITTDVENYPGFPDGIQGPEMMEKFRAQAARFGTEIVSKTVTRVDLASHPFTVFVGDESWQVPAVILATGSTARWLELPGEEAFHGKGLSACATCDGFFFRDQEVAVVGGGDTAMEEATYLAGICKKVTVIHRRDELRASKIMQQRALDTENIDFAWSREIAEYLPDDDGMLRGLRLESTKGEDDVELPVTGCFIAIGHIPNSEFLEGQIETDDSGYVITKPDRTATNVEGVFACGDLQDHVWRQAVTAAGTGCMSAIECERWLAEKGF
jgi:thioredoxin reductase (NADPH)